MMLFYLSLVEYRPDIRR